MPTGFVGMYAPVRIGRRRHANERRVCATRGFSPAHGQAVDPKTGGMTRRERKAYEDYEKREKTENHTGV